MSDALPATANKSAYQSLPRRYRRFVDHYVTGLTGVAAIQAVGCKSPHARTVAARVLRRPEVQAALEERTREVIADAGVRHERIIREMYAIATSDPRKLVDPATGMAVPLEKLDADIAAAISSVEVENISINGETGTRYKYRLWDKNKAADKLGQYLKLWDATRTSVTVDARSVTVNNGGGEAVLRAVDELLARAARVGESAANPPVDPHGPVLPAAVRDGSAGHRSSVDAGADSGSPE